MPKVIHAQTQLFSGPTTNGKKDTSSTFVGNMSVPIHKWYRFSAGFSAEWVRQFLRLQKAKDHEHILDPFAGSGTALLEAETCGLVGLGLEAHPFIFKVADAKLAWRADSIQLGDAAEDLLRRAKAITVRTDDPPDLVKKCYDRRSFEKISSLILALKETDADESIQKLLWLALVSVFRECSGAGTAQWQYVLPNQRKASVSEPYSAFAEKAAMMIHDMRLRQALPSGPQATVSRDDARICDSVEDGWADIIVTSPPYANNYDYADATRLELTVLGEIERWSDLHDAVRSHLIPSCTQHVSKHRNETNEILSDPILDPIREEITLRCEKLSALSEERRGRKAYHTMIAAYFKNMAQVWRQLRRVTREGGTVCFVVGDSAPYGVHVPVDEWLGKLALESGFHGYRFEKTRDRNLKWKNRKHRVPLHEGRLWVQA